jgi:hypothetical protein
MLEILVINYKPIGKILLISVIFLTIHVVVLYDKIKRFLLDNWGEYRSHPLVIPFAGFIKPEEGKTALESSSSNFKKVIANMVSSLLKILMTPIYPILQLLLNLFNTIKGVLNGIRGQINVMRNFMFKLFEKMYIRLQNGMAALTFYFLKLREGLKRSYGLFNLVIGTVEHSFMFFESLVKGPVGKFGQIVGDVGYASAIFTLGPWGHTSWEKAVCFNPNTSVVMNNGYRRVLNDIKVGDILIDDNKVIAKIDVEYPPKYIYSLYGIEVTRSHFVYYNNSWIRAGNHPDILCIPYNYDKVVCLVTQTGIININNVIFKDYLEIHDISVNKNIDKMIEDYLNNTTESEYTSSIDLLSGIPISSNIYNGDILGTVYIDPEILTMYDIDGQYLSSNTLILENGKWVRAYKHSRAVFIGKINTPCVNYVTTSEKIILDNGLVIRDFTETRDDSLNDTIDTYTEQHL